MKNTHEQLNLLRSLNKNPKIAQRQLAKNLDFSLGKLNYCLKALKSKGYIKIQNFKKNKNKLIYIYILTPKGIKRKTSLTTKFIKQKMKEYDELKKEIEQ